MSKQNINNVLKLYNANYYSEPVLDEKLLKFHNALEDYIEKIKFANNNNENEEHIKNIVNTFLKDNFYQDNKYSINTDQYIDSTIKTNGDLNVIIETKKIKNKAEMLDEDSINKKALWELTYYFLESTRDTSEQKVKMHKRVELRRLIVTDGLNWFMFNANDLQRFCDGYLENMYFKYKNNQLTYAKDISKFYEEIKEYYEKININEKLDYLYFNVQNIISKKRFEKYLYKIFNRTFLLKEKYTGVIRSNTLNEKFYQELLYIMGLKEVKESAKSNKNIIVIDQTIKNSFADQLYHKFKYDKDRSEEESIDKTFELIIIWLDRLLFIKLFEGQLRLFNGDSSKYKILSNDKIKSFDDLQNLFFNVLGRKEREVNEFYNLFYEIPYLNSSLFERQEIESADININEIRNLQIKLKNNSVLGKKGNTEEELLKYVIDFFNCYIFGAESDEDGIYHEKADIIDASVLGLIFEKINGYKDGSFYTPSPITEFMAGDIIKKTIIEKINKELEWDCKDIDDIRFKLSFNPSLELTEKINKIVDSITICDPAVGSGHFLVSSLNQIIAIKARLGIIFINNSKELLRNCEIFVQDDTLKVTDAQGNLFRYDKNNLESQKIQETLFNEKRRIIEQSLFGVDINSKAVYICQLRLWIELLKNAYYKNNVMETLPNIDINIKVGNSLISKLDYTPGLKIGSRSSIDKDEKNTLREYKNAVKVYKSENDKNRKKQLKTIIRILKNKMYSNYVQLTLFGETDQLNNYLKYQDAFEWAIEFPEIISNDLVFEGFDIIIGNPPYGLINKKQNQTTSINSSINQYEYYKNSLLYAPARGGVINIYRLFICLSNKLLKSGGRCSLIYPLAFMCDLSAFGVRKYLFDNTKIDFIEAFPERDNAKKRVFENVKMSVCITSFTKIKPKKNASFDLRINNDRYVDENNVKTPIEIKSINKISEKTLNIPLVDEKELKLLEKICEDSTRLIEYSKCYTGEVDISLQKQFITSNSDMQPLLRGAQIQKYEIIKDISQGELFYLLKDKYLDNNKGERAEHYKKQRIGMQGITGINEKYRLKMAYIPENSFCANSVNYLIPNEKYIYFLIGFLNSKIINWYFKKMSTNSNVNGYEIDELPIKNISEIDRNLIDNYAKIIIYNNDKEKIDMIDKILYKAYNLTDEEIQLIEDTYK